MENSSLERLQKVVLSIADEVIKICERHQLKYYLAEGSLLGAIRHEGMIPWDDDIDIVMPRSDYDQLLSYLDAELPSHMKALTYHRTQSHHRYFIQVESSELQVIETGHNIPLQRNAWIDIFPLDDAPHFFFSKKLYMFGLLYRRMRVQLSQFDEMVDLHRKNRPFHERIIILLSRKLKWGRNNDPVIMLDRLDHFLRKKACSSSQNWINALSAYKSRAIMPKKYYGEGLPARFNGRSWIIPDQPHEMLKQLYGDYMTLPPEDARNNHHITIID